MQVRLGEKLLFAGERKFNHLTIPLTSYSISSCKCCKDKLNLDYARAGPPSHRRRGACLLFILPPRLRFKSLRLASTVYSTYGIWYPFKLSACLGMMSFRHCVKWKGGGSPQLQNGTDYMLNETEGREIKAKIFMGPYPNDCSWNILVRYKPDKSSF